MTTLEDQMSFYATCHQDARNKATHFFGAPLIAFSLMIPLGWLRMDVDGFPVSAALVVTSILLLYYLALDIPLGLAISVVFALMLWGHVFEGRKLALLESLFQIFVAPIFLAAEAFFALGCKPKLHEAVQRRAMQMRAQAGVPAGSGTLKSA